MGKERLQEIRQEIGDVERMLKAMIKSLKNKHLNPGPLGPFLATNWEKNLTYLLNRTGSAPLVAQENPA